MVDQRSTKQPNNKKNKVSTEGEEDEREQRREKEGKGVEKEDGVRERENKQEEDTGGQERIKGSQGKVQDPTPSTTASTPVNPVPRKHAQFDWATDIDSSIGPTPNASDFHPTKPPPPLASLEPAPHLLNSPVAPSQPICTLPKPTVTPSNGDVAPRAPTPTTGTPTAHTSPDLAPPKCTVTPFNGDVALRAHTPVIGASADTTPAAYTPTTPAFVNPDPSGIAVLITPILPTVYGPRDLSALHLGTGNPWGSLRRRHYGRYPQALRQFTCCRQHQQKHSVSTHVHKIPTPKPPIPTSCIFETITHPLGIGPTKPVIRVPARMTMDTPTHTAPSHRDIVKSAPPSPPPHPAATVQCHCGQLVPIPSIQQSHSIPLHHTLSSFISHLFLLPFSFPGQFFSRFAFA